MNAQRAQWDILQDSVQARFDRSVLSARLERGAGGFL